MTTPNKRRTSERNWINLMSDLRWMNIENWSIINKETQLREIPKAQDWVRHNLKFIPSSKAQEAFKAFYFPTLEQKTEDRSQYFYTLKAYAEYTLAGLYLYQTTGV